MHGIAQAVWEKTGNEKARQAAFRLRQYQMGIALRHREEPFMAHQPVATVAAPFCPGGIAENIRSALFFRHPHAN